MEFKNSGHTAGVPRPERNSEHTAAHVKGWWVLYFHDIIYNGKNAMNAISAIAGAPAWANKAETVW